MLFNWILFVLQFSSVFGETIDCSNEKRKYVVISKHFKSYNASKNVRNYYQNIRPSPGSPSLSLYLSAHYLIVGIVVFFCTETLMKKVILQSSFINQNLSSIKIVHIIFSNEMESKSRSKYDIIT